MTSKLKDMKDITCSFKKRNKIMSTNFLVWVQLKHFTLRRPLSNSSIEMKKDKKENHHNVYIFGYHSAWLS